MIFIQSNNVFKQGSAWDYLGYRKQHLGNSSYWMKIDVDWQQLQNLAGMNKETLSSIYF